MININELTIGQVKELASLLGFSPSGSKGHPCVGREVIIRTYSAGVHFGTLVSAEGKEVCLKNARRIWSWEGAFTLNAVAMEGVKSAKMPMPVTEIYLTEAIEIIPCSEKAAEQLREMISHV